MPRPNSASFSAKLDIIGVNPFVLVPQNLLEAIFIQAGKNKGAIPVKGRINGTPFTQTLVRFQGEWRLYINTKMLKNSPKRVGELLVLTLEFDPGDRSIAPHPLFLAALEANMPAKAVFDSLRPSLQKEIVRYLSFLKSETAIAANVDRAIGFLLGKNRFIGRDKP